VSAGIASNTAIDTESGTSMVRAQCDRVAGQTAILFVGDSSEGFRWEGAAHYCTCTRGSHSCVANCGRCSCRVLLTALPLVRRHALWRRAWQRNTSR
jgi:hypothetical protein